MKRYRLLIVLILAAGVIGFGIWRSSKTAAGGAELIGFQDFDAPLEMPKGGAPDMRFHFLSAWEAYQVPTVTSMDTPMGSENGALVYNAQKFFEMNEKRGGHHTGDDLNGIGGMNSDLGDPVFAAGDGLVVYAGEPSPGWGNVVVLAHRRPDGEQIHSMYAHLLQINTRLGELVARGEKIGSVGTANGYYPAHLHFEIRKSDGVDIGSGYTSMPLNRLNPQQVIDALHDSGADGISPSYLKYASVEAELPWTTIEMKNAEKMPQLEK
ncbi:murein hydrolase activator EnvC family protein [Luteolibacter sp. AS25]|uniref:murein hydrolase activator EnvC family protein n=1 Tax=Luteolibacter sp. AS25 TaxID=3135776 RepID=UPI00398AC5AE